MATSLPSTPAMITAFALLSLLLGCKPTQRVAADAPAPPTAPAPAPASADAPNDGRNAVRWVQTAAEYQALCRQAYTAAQLALDEALEDSTWTAALEQRDSFQALPPAVVLDLDETVLDNAEYQARLVRAGGAYSPESWAAWTAEEIAGAVPGALDYTREAAARGIAVVYVTNRRAGEEEATRRNLTALGFPLATAYDAVLTRGERPDWDSADKSPRRRDVARRFRILQLVGDSFGDFLQPVSWDAPARASLVNRYAELWGLRWIVLPNPMYGEWLVEE